MEPLIIQILFLIPLGLLANWLRILHAEVRKVKEDSLTKAETKELITLTLKPIERDIQHINDNLSEMKRMLTKVLDDKD